MREGSLDPVLSGLELHLRIKWIDSYKSPIREVTKYPTTIKNGTLPYFFAYLFITICFRCEWRGELFFSLSPFFSLSLSVSTDSLFSILIPSFTLGNVQYHKHDVFMEHNK